MRAIESGNNKAKQTQKIMCCGKEKRGPLGGCVG